MRPQPPQANQLPFQELISPNPILPVLVPRPQHYHSATADDRRCSCCGCGRCCDTALCRGPRSRPHASRVMVEHATRQSTRSLHSVPPDRRVHASISSAPSRSRLDTKPVEAPAISAPCPPCAQNRLGRRELLGDLDIRPRYSDGVRPRRSVDGSQSMDERDAEPRCATPRALVTVTLPALPLTAVKSPTITTRKTSIHYLIGLIGRYEGLIVALTT